MLTLVGAANEVKETSVLVLVLSVVSGASGRASVVGSVARGVVLLVVVGVVVLVVVVGVVVVAMVVGTVLIVVGGNSGVLAGR